MKIITRTNILFTAVILFCLIPSLGASEVEVVPVGDAPLINGFEGDNEWFYPDVFRAGWTSFSIRMKKDFNHLYVCLKDPDTIHTGVDLYIDNLAGDIFMLHVSSAHGERHLKDSLWGLLEMGPAQNWSSNLVQMAVEDGQRVVLSGDLFEFQIDKKLLPNDQFKMMIHLKRPELWVPANADTLSSADWYEFELYRR